MSSRQLTDGAKPRMLCKRNLRFLVRFLHELLPLHFCKQVRRITLRHAQFCVQRHHLLALCFPRGVDVPCERRRAEGGNILPCTVAQAGDEAPFPRAQSLPAEEVSSSCSWMYAEDHLPPRFDQAVPRHLLDFMQCFATFRRTLELVEQVRKDLSRLAKPILNFDNHRSGS